MAEDKTNMTILAIVAIVAIVGLIILFTKGAGIEKERRVACQCVEVRGRGPGISVR